MRRFLSRPAVAAGMLLLLLLSAAPARAQTPPPAIAEAERLRADRRFGEAVRLLESVLATTPEDLTAMRLLGQTLYWMQEISRARAVYERAIASHPDDARLRLDYGRMLVETGDRRRARTVLQPARDRGDARAEASALLGTLAYWDGDLTAAARLFSEAIASGSTDPQVHRQLRDIRHLSAPWIRIAPAAFRDDQPLDRAGGRLDTGWFLTPLVPLELHGEWQRYRAADDDPWMTVWSGEARIRAYVPRARVDLEAAAGIVRRPAPAEARWTGRMGVGFRLGRGIAIGGRLKREVYLRTAASLGADVTLTAGDVRLTVDHPRGWLGEAAVGRQRFFDGNDVRHAYGWLLAPVAQRPAFGLQIGYSGGWHDSEALRFVLPPPDRLRLILAPETRDAGRYDPYHTPLDQRTHAVLAALRVSSRPATLRLSGSVGVRAEEDYPFFFITAAGVPALAIARRRFTPWSGRLALEFPLTGRAALSLEGDAGRAAFYDWVGGVVQFTYRFTPRAAAPPPSR